MIEGRAAKVLPEPSAFISAGIFHTPLQIHKIISWQFHEDTSPHRLRYRDLTCRVERSKASVL